MILLTAKAAEADKIDGLNIGADDYVSKPFSMPELSARIANLIASRRRLLARLSPPVPMTPTPVDVPSADERFLLQVKDTIEAHLAEPDFSVQSLADAIGLSRVHLHRRLRDLLNQTPTEVLRNMRLERSADLLRQRAGSISEIAYAVGFKSVAHFSNSFRKKFGEAPSTYQSTAG